MARVTVEDCIEKIDNRFDLVLLAAHRARMISAGAQITVDRDNDKNPVVSLREIGDGAISPEDLREDLIHSLQKYVEVDEPEKHAAPLLDANADEDSDTFDTISEDELLRVTGYTHGAVAPFGLPQPMRVLVDESVLAEDEVSLGSGVRGTAVILRRADLMRALGNVETGKFT